MLRYILIYGFLFALIAILLVVNEYWFWYKMKSFNSYGIVVAAIFLFIGLYFGNKRNNNMNTTQDQALNSDYEINPTFNNLSKREQEVLLLMSKGLTNLEIAAQLFISENTVKTHISRIFEKLQVKNRTTALIKAKESGIIKEVL